VPRKNVPIILSASLAPLTADSRMQAENALDDLTRAVALRLAEKLMSAPVTVSGAEEGKAECQTI